MHCTALYCTVIMANKCKEEFVSTYYPSLALFNSTCPDRHVQSTSQHLRKPFSHAAALLDDFVHKHLALSKVMNAEQTELEQWGMNRIAQTFPARH